MKPKTTTPSPHPKQGKLAILPLSVWPLLFLSQIIVAALFAWHLLAQFDFAYPIAYDTLDIDEHIELFAPKNRYRPDFETTTKDQHFDLFSQIGVAIQDDGNSLSKITYTTADNKTYTLLRKAEVIHLQDVANLVNVFYSVGYVALLVLIITTVIAKVNALTFPSIKAIAAGIVGLLLLIGAILFGIGPRKVFYWLHVQIFPPDHEWFFYYQESLMTTLMNAPILFGFIGAVMGGILLIFWIAEIAALRALLNHQKAQQ